MDPPTPVDLPPPAYSAEQQELDRKISDALQQSLHISSQPTQPTPSDDVYEEWDEAKYEAAARARAQDGEPAQVLRRSSAKENLAREDVEQSRASHQSSSSRTNSPQVRTQYPGRRLPASPPANTTTKERPSWFTQAQLDTYASIQIHQIPPEERSPDEQLPAFTAVGPTLDGPPFEDIVRVQPRDAVRVAPGDSPPQSPLDAVDGSDGPLRPSHPSSSISPLRPHVRRDRDTRSPPESASRTAVASIPAPHPSRTTPAAAAPARPPPIKFDNSIAYARNRTLPIDTGEKSPGPVDASAFYNSAVSSFLVGPSKTANKANTVGHNRPSLSSAGSSFRASDSAAPRVTELRRASEPYVPALSSAPGGSPVKQTVHSTVIYAGRPSHTPQQHPHSSPQQHSNASTQHHPLPPTHHSPLQPSAQQHLHSPLQQLPSPQQQLQSATQQHPYSAIQQHPQLPAQQHPHSAVHQQPYSPLQQSPHPSTQQYPHSAVPHLNLSAQQQPHTLVQHPHIQMQQHHHLVQQHTHPPVQQHPHPSVQQHPHPLVQQHPHPSPQQQPHPPLVQFSHPPAHPRPPAHSHPPSQQHPHRPAQQHPGHLAQHPNHHQVQHPNRPVQQHPHHPAQQHQSPHHQSQSSAAEDAAFTVDLELDTYTFPQQYGSQPDYSSPQPEYTLEVDTYSVVQQEYTGQQGEYTVQEYTVQQEYIVPQDVDSSQQTLGYLDLNGAPADDSVLNLAAPSDDQGFNVVESVDFQASDAAGAALDVSSWF